MSMIDHAAPARTPYQDILAQVFEHEYTHVNVFSADQFPTDLLEIFSSVVTEGKSINELEVEFFGDVYENKPLTLVVRGFRPGKHCERLVCGIQALLGSKSHHHAAMAYIQANARHYEKISSGFFNVGTLDLDLLPLVSSFPTLPNYCRNADGSIRSHAQLESFMLESEDTFVLLLSAIANLDSDAVTALASCAGAENVFWILRNQINQCPGMGLEEAFGHFFEQRTHVTFLGEIRQLLELSSATLADFERAFWPGSTSLAIDKLVCDAVKSSLRTGPQNGYMLEAFGRCSVDFYPGLVMSEQGIAHYLDAVTALPDLPTRQFFIMDVVASRTKVDGIKEDNEDLSALLLSIPLETLMAHPDAELLLQYLYVFRKDTSILKLIKDKEFKAKMLELSMGL